jgi:PAS domain S-box-containing protein
MASIDKIMKSRLPPSQAPGNDKSWLGRTSKKIKAEIEKRFGFFPPFFTPALKTPEILENLWQQTLSAYVNNPLPALFKEKLFAYLSRYCAVPYCIICHSCALRPLGMTAAEVLALLTEPGPATEMDIGKHRDVLAAQSSPLEEWPAPGSALDESLMACSIFSFLNPSQAEDCRAQLRHLLGEEMCAYLMVFLGYVKTCHLWVEAHPELAYEADQRARENLGPLLAEEPRLAEFFRNYNELIAREPRGREERLRAEQKRTEAALLESEEKYRVLFESIDQGFCTIEVLFDENERPVDYRFLVVNPTFERQTGIENATGRRMREIAPLHEEHWFEIYGHIALTGKPMRFENSAEQLHRFYDVYAWRIGEPAERKVAILFNDITERRKIEQALRESEVRMAGIINSAMDAIISVDDGQRVILFNAAAERMFGYSAAEVIGRPITRLIPERFRASHEDHIRRFSVTGETSRAMGALGAVSGLRRGGEEFPIEASISQLEAGGQKLFTVILRDITERNRAEEQLIEQAALLDQSHEAIVVRDLDNRIRYWSRGAERLYGWMAEETVGRLVGELTYREDLSQLAEATEIVIEKGKWNGEMRHITKDGRKVTVEGHWTLVRDAEGNPKTILAINTDVTEKKKLEAQFLRTQRLESIGTLASGIAHDLNNILSPILMGAQMLQIYLPAHEAANRREVEEIRHEILPGGGELILVIDDEDAIREMTRTILERFGYRALTADNGATALGIFASHKDEISIVITDMMMPVMDGPVTIRALQKLNPQVRIIASSGLTESIDAADLDRLGVKTFLIKPYDAKTLLKTVAQALR